MDDLLSDFLAETNESLTELDKALVQLERAPEDQATISLIFRYVHTIKGTCGFLGLPRLERVAHAGEDVLGLLRDAALSPTTGVIDAVLRTLDCIRTIVSGLETTGTEPEGDDTELIEGLRAIARGEAAAEAVRAQDVATTEAAPSAAPAVKAMPAAQISEPEIIPPPAVAANPLPPKPPVSAPPTPRQGETAPDAPQDHAAAAGQTIRVSVDVLEDLMTLVSELVLTRNQLMQISRAQHNAQGRGQPAGHSGGGDAFAVFATPLQRLSHITSDLQESVMKTRMQPIGNAWSKLPRLVRDLAHELGKKIDLVIHGAETELDRHVLELIKDPLTHMVRNSADHGLERPGDRRAAGKKETGQIVLNAYHEGGLIAIEVADDGRGLPVARIRAKALANGLASEAELAAMAEDQVLRFIFHPGFSTAAEVTSVSGRGVGMDVVKTNIEKIGGTIELTSNPGLGTRFTIKIPLTLAIVSALIVEAAGERFAIPQFSVVELVRAHRGETGAAEPGAGQEGGGTAAVIETIDSTPLLRLRERLVPLVDLADLLRLTPADRNDGGSDQHIGETDDSVTIVIAEIGSGKLGIIVSRVCDTEEIVVKPVAPILRHITMFSGNTILGDGSVIMILDPNGIARATGIGSRENGGPVAQTAEIARGSGAKQAILLFRADGLMGCGPLLGVPLSQVARLEQIPCKRIEHAGGNLVTQYRGRLLPLVSWASDPAASQAGADEDRPVLVFGGADRGVGLLVDEIVDVVDDELRVELAASHQGLRGAAVVGGRATDIIDTDYLWRCIADPVQS